jgi:hypothetical protein
MAVAPYSTFTYKNPYIAQAKLSVTKAIFVQDLSSRPEILHKILHRNLVLLICDRTGLTMSIQGKGLEFQLNAWREPAIQKNFMFMGRFARCGAAKLVSLMLDRYGAQHHIICVVLLVAAVVWTQQYLVFICIGIGSFRSLNESPLEGGRCK